MSAQWAEAASRGQFDLELLTRELARCEGYDLPEERHYLGVVHPTDGRAAFVIGFLRLANVAEFAREMAPCSIAVRAASYEDADALRAALADLALSGEAVH